MNDFGMALLMLWASVSFPANLYLTFWGVVFLGLGFIFRVFGLATVFGFAIADLFGIAFVTGFFGVIELLFTSFWISTM